MSITLPSRVGKRVVKQIRPRGKSTAGDIPKNGLYIDPIGIISSRIWRRCYQVVNTKCSLLYGLSVIRRLEDYASFCNDAAY